MKSPAVIFYEAFEEEIPLLQKYLGTTIQAEYTWKTIQECHHEQPPTRVISIRTQSVIPTHWSTSLDAIHARTTGYDHLLAYQEKVATSPKLGALQKYCGRAVAEQALLLWLALWRKLPLQIENFDQFSRDGLTGHECERKTLLVVGVGDIGYQVIKIGQGLGMHVLGVDIERRHQNVHYVDISGALPQADVIVCAMNLTADNRAYFSYDALKKAKKGALFVNVSRGELSPLKDLQQLLDEEVLAGVALDVYENEGVLAAELRQNTKNDSPDIDTIRKLQADPRVILTPHNAFNSWEALDRKCRQSAEQILHVVRTGEFLWPLGK